MKTDMKGSISTRVTVSLMALVSIMVLLAIFTALSFYRASHSATQITQNELPFLTSVFSLVLESERMASMAPDVIVAQNRFVRQALTEEFVQQSEDWEKRVILAQNDYGNVPKLENLVSLFRVLHGNLSELSRMIDAKMSLENQMSQMVRRIQKLGERINGSQREYGFVEDGGRGLFLYKRINYDITLLLGASSASRFGELRLLEKRYKVQEEPNFGKADKNKHLYTIISELKGFATGKGSLFALSEQRLGFDKCIEDLLVANTFVSEQIDINTENLLRNISLHVYQIAKAIAQQLTFATRLSFLLPVLGGIFSIFIILHLRRSVVGRLLALQTAIQRQRDGEMVAIPISGNDEIAQMGRSTRFYINEIQLRERELQKSHDELELRVVNRTLKINSQNWLLRKEIEERRLIEKALRESENRLKYLSAKLIAAQEEERGRLAAELHDNIGPLLGAMKFGVENAIGASAVPDRQDETLRVVVGMVKDVNRHIGRLQMELRPSIIDDLGILDAVDWYCSEYVKIYHHIQIEQIIHTRDEFIPKDLKIVLYRIIQESLNNVAKHSGATAVTINIETEGEFFYLRVTDNGCGIAKDFFDGAQFLGNRKESGYGGLGLVSMRERVELSQGTFTITNEKDVGVGIICSWHQSPMLVSD